MRLKDRVAIVTGGAQGIGREYCLRFAREGASVVIADLRADQAKAVEAEVAELGGQAMAVEADVSNEASAEEMARRAQDRFGRIDALVNNAAIYYDLDRGNESVDYLRKVLDVNVIGILIAGRAVFPYMKEQGGGSIINIASIAGYSLPGGRPGDNFSANAYGLSKSGVIYLTKSMAKQGGGHGIRVNAIAPGVTMSEATKKVVPEAMVDNLTNASALGHSLEPPDLTGTAVFLASDESALMTGQTLVVDGGVIMNA